MQAQPHLIDSYTRHELNLDLSIYPQSSIGRAKPRNIATRITIFKLGYSRRIFCKNLRYLWTIRHFYNAKHASMHRFRPLVGVPVYLSYIGPRENIVTYGFLGTVWEYYSMTDAKFNSDSFVRHLQRLLRKFGSVGTITNRAALPCSKMHKEFVCDNDRLEILHRPRSFLSITSLNNADINQRYMLRSKCS